MSTRFDELTKALGKGLTRRQALGRIAAYTGGSLFGLFSFARKAQGVDVGTCNLVCRVFPTAADRNRCLAVCRACPSLAQLCGATAASLTCFPASAVTNASGLAPVAGVCRPVCNPGFVDCDGNPLTGCEANLSNDVNNCGNCGQVCGPYANGTPFCGASTCNVLCNSGFGNCNFSLGDGCETNLSNDVNNCGACSHVCFAQNGTAGCSGSNCTVVSCNPGFADCDHNPGNGCEVNLSNDVNNCGSCGHVCFVQNGTAGCSGSNCTVVSCNPGFADCDNSAGNGCEVNINTSPTNCGSCGHVCSLPNTAVHGCSAGVCMVVSCNAGFADCDNNPANGCETNINTSVNNCGACGHICPGGQTCSNGVCH